MDQQLIEVELEKIRPNRLNPRFEMDIVRLNDLADSIKQVGLLESLVVRPIGDGYEVVVGERRYRASQQAGLKTVPCLVRQYTDEEVLELNLIENIQREDLSAVEKGNCCKQLLEQHPKKFGNIQALANRLGVSFATIKTWIKLTEAPQEIKKMVAPSQVERKGTLKGKIDYTTATTIMRQILEPERRVELSRKLASEGISQKLARRVVKEASKSPEKKIEEIVTQIKEEPHELIFEPNDMEPVLKGVKTQVSCSRQPDPKIKTGVTVRASVYLPHFADLQVVAVERKRLKYFDEKDAKREGHSSLADFINMWKIKYGEYKGDELVHIIRFEKMK
jgi:ParB family chromosome partitioning protein